MRQFDGLVQWIDMGLDVYRFGVIPSDIVTVTEITFMGPVFSSPSEKNDQYRPCMVIVRIK